MRIMSRVGNLHIDKKKLKIQCNKEHEDDIFEENISKPKIECVTSACVESRKQYSIKTF